MESVTLLERDAEPDAGAAGRAAGVAVASPASRR